MLNKDKLIKAVLAYKDGILNESTDHNDFMVSSAYYNSTMPMMLVNENLTLSSNAELVVNEGFIAKSQNGKIISELNAVIARNDKFLKSDQQLKESTNVNDYIKKIVTLGKSEKPSVITELTKHYIGLNREFFDSETITALKKGIVECLSLTTNEYVMNNMMLDEGLVKIPMAAYNQIQDYATYSLYEMLLMKVHDTSEMNILSSIMERVGYDAARLTEGRDMVSADENFMFDKSHGVHGYTVVNISKEDMPYSDSMEANIDLNFITDETKSLGSKYSDKLISVTLNFNDLFRYISQLDDVRSISEKNVSDKIMFMFRDLQSTIEHELIHVVQELVFAVHEKSKVLSKDSEVNDASLDEHEHYLLSIVEFDPHVNDTINSFRKYVESLDGYVDSIDPTTLVALLKYNLSAVPDVPATFKGTVLENPIKNIFQPNEFIRLLKEHKPDQWKRAVKKIINEF